jgi:hypothetical protein
LTDLFGLDIFGLEANFIKNTKKIQKVKNKIKRD